MEELKNGRIQKECFQFIQESTIKEIEGVAK
jgi:hypothetical protein